MLLKLGHLRFVLIALAIWSPSPLLAQTNPQKSNAEVPTVRIPFVGCESDGQVGPHPAPEGESKVVRLDAVVSKRLAFYKSEETGGLLAPRGWHGFGAYGSMGTTLYVSPQHLIFDDLQADITGSVLIEWCRTGETSGRMEVARVFARVFPSQKAYVKSVKEAYPDLDLPFGPYPKDTLKYRSDSIVEFRTPPHSEGLGSSFGLTPNDEPITGVVISGEGPSVAVLVVRLPPDQDDLTAYIIQQFESNESEP